MNFIAFIFLWIICYYYLSKYSSGSSQKNVASRSAKMYSSQGGTSHTSFKLNVPVYSADKKTFTVYVKGSYSILKSTYNISHNGIQDTISRYIRKYYSNINFSASPLEHNKNELAILDDLRELLKSYASLESFEISLENNESFDKVDCVHYEEVPRKKVRSTNFDYVATNKGAISNVNDDYITSSDNPIRESSSVASIIHNTLNNMESNVDPIDNKF